MYARPPNFFVALWCWLVLVVTGGAQVAQPVTSGVSITSTNQTTTLDRATGRLHSSVRLTVENTGASLVEGPLHLVVGFLEANGQPLGPLNVTGALGGIDVAPYNRHYFDCDEKAGGDGLAPGESFQLTLAFDRPRTLVVSYQPELWGFVNQPPQVLAGGPYRATAGEMVTLDASGSSDPEGDELTFSWRLPDGTLLEGPSVQTVFTQAGIQQVTLTIRDSRGATSLRQIEVAVLPAGEFALGRTRVLDGLGHPLDDVGVDEQGPQGGKQFTLQDGGFGSLGSEPGDYLWRFSKAGHLGVCRSATLSAGEVGVIPNPWMQKLSTQGTPLSVLNATVLANADASLRITFPGGAFTQAAPGFLTELHGQALPGPLPAGWSPLRAFHLVLPQAPLQPASLSIALGGAVPPGRDLLICSFDPAGCEWIARELVTPDSGSVSAALAEAGTFCLVLADADPTAPPTATIGSALAGFATEADTEGVSATGTVVPPEAAASRVASEVTSLASVVFEGTGPLPSGTWFQANVRERYELSNGQTLVLPGFDQTYYAYRGSGADPAVVNTAFPLRPVLLFGPEELNLATVHVDVLGRTPFPGGVIAPEGGVLAAGPLSITLPAGGVLTPAAAGLRLLATEPFEPFAGGLGIIGAFSLDVGDLQPGTRLGFAYGETLAPDAFFVLCRLVTRGERTGLTPVQRLASDSSGRLADAEPASGARLPGITGGGQFLLLQTAGPQALVQGTAASNTGPALGGIAIRVTGTPWLVFSRADGSYQILAPVGASQVLAVNPADGNGGGAPVDVGTGTEVIDLNLEIGPIGPRVTFVQPADGATGVDPVTPIEVLFSEALDPASFGPTGVALHRVEDGALVSAGLSLNLAANRATLLPTNPLEYDKNYEIRVSSALTDSTGLPVEGPTSFFFTTRPQAARGEGAQFVIYEPDAAMIPAEVLADLVGYTPGGSGGAVVCHGSAGTADPEVPVILVNETTGATATVLSKPDGSFANFIRADEDDFITATFINQNRSRISIPARKQLFDDGSVGLYQAGGILEAESDGGPVEILIEPEAVETRARFKLSPLDAVQLFNLLEGTVPQDAKMLGGAQVEISGDVTDGGSEFSLPLDPADLELDPGVAPEDAALALAVVREVDGEKAFQVVDKMRYEDGRATTNTFPFLGFLASLGAEAIFEEALSFTLVAVLIGTDPVVVHGTVVEQKVDQNGNPVGPKKPLRGAFVRAAFPGQEGRAGRIDAGAVYATSDEKGEFTLALPIDAGSAALPWTPAEGYVLLATHPRFPGPGAAPISWADYGIGIGRDLVIRPEIVMRGALLGVFGSPRVNVAHSPLYPAVGEDVTVQVNGTQGVLAPPNILVVKDTVEPVVEGDMVNVSDVTLSNTMTETLGPGRTRWSGTLNADKPMLLKLKVSVLSGASSSGTSTIIPYYIRFGGDPPVPQQNIVPSDQNDAIGPLVTGTIPVEGATLPAGSPVTLFFNEPVDKSVETNFSQFTLSPGDAAIMSVKLSPDQTRMEVYTASHEPDTEYTLTLAAAAVQDLSGNDMDQVPSTMAADSFSFRFFSPPAVTGALPNLHEGGGAVLDGNYLYALDRDDNFGLKVYEVSTPSQPSLAGSALLPRGRPRDLAFIPDYSYAPSLSQNPVTSNLLAVVGGDPGGIVDADGNVYNDGQYLRIFDVGDPTNPQPLVSAIITFRQSVVPKVLWDPPFLVFHEFGADLQQIGFINLQEFILGFTASETDILTFPPGGQIGKDLNGDGDYVDSGEILPLPPQDPTEFFGKSFAFVVDSPWRKVNDFDSQGVTVGVVMDELDSSHPAAYRTLSFGGQEISPTNGVVAFPGARPKRVALFDNLPVEINGTVDVPFLALVSLSPDSDGIDKLAVVDITLPETPMELSRIPLPETEFPGVAQSIQLRGDGLLELALTHDAVLLDPLKLALPVPSSGSGGGSSSPSQHPAIVGTVAGGGSGNRAVPIGDAGIRAINLGGRTEVVQTSPEIRIVRFQGGAPVFDTSTDLVNLDDEMLEDLFGFLSVENGVRPSRLKGVTGVAEATLDPPSPLVHYYVLVKAPGGGGAEMKIAVESLNRGLRPYKNKGLNFPPVRAVDTQTLTDLDQDPRVDCDAPINPLTAYRLSDEVESPFHNVYLTKPFALVSERITEDQLTDLQTVLDREILWSGYYLRASIDPYEANSAVVGPFASEVDSDSKEILSRCGVTLPTLPGEYLMGSNPPPAGGFSSMPGTGGSIAAHSGEFRHTTTDMALPSRRMPVVIERTIGGRDLYDGPFGRGWDYNYNQRIVELKSSVFPQGSKLPLIDFKQAADDVIAESKDLLFHTGYGRAIHFRLVGEDGNAPVEFSNDPLVTDLGWDADGDRFYLPEKGVYDIVIKFPDMKYVRLTPEGTQYWYGPDGKLLTIYDRYEANNHSLEYNSRGELVRITDNSVTSDRFVEVGYWRLNGDPELVSGLDEGTDKAFLAGKIRRFKDYTGTDVLFDYNDDGVLTTRKGPDLAGANGGFSGRPVTSYEMEGCDTKGVTVGSSGAPLFAADVMSNMSEEAVAMGGNGLLGPVSITIDADAGSADWDGLITKAALSGGENVEFEFDERGYPKRMEVSGGMGGSASYMQEHEDTGEVKKITYPEGNTEERTYDINNASFRSRGNLLMIKRIGGPRGGGTLTQDFHYDAKYNQLSGAVTDFNGNSMTYTLTNDGRDVGSIDYPNAGVHTFDFDATYGQLGKETRPTGVVTEYTYETATGFPKTKKLGSNTTTYSYDSTVAGKLGSPTGIELPQGGGGRTPIALKYDRMMQLTETKQGALVETRGYNEQGHLESVSQDLDSGVTMKQSRSYTENGFLEEVTFKQIEVDGTASDYTVMYTPDERFRVKQITYPGGTVQDMTYDNQGSLRMLTVGQYTEEFIRDLHGNVVERKVGGESVETTDYDGHDRPETITKKTGSGNEVQANSFYGEGQLKTTTITDPVKGVVFDKDVSQIDSLGRPKQVDYTGDTINPSYTYTYATGSMKIQGPRQTSTSTYDDAGFPTGFSDAILTVVQMPSAVGKPLTIERMEDGATYKATFTYDGLDNVDMHTDDLGMLFDYGTRADGRITSVKNARANTTTQTWTKLGEIASRRRADGMKIEWEYDERRNLKHEGDGTAGRDYTYDGTFRRDSMSLRDGAQFTYGSFDGRNMPQSVTMPGGNMSLGYDLQGRLVSQDITYGGGTFTLTTTWDALDRMVGKSYDGNTATFTFDKAGPMTKAEYSETGGDFTVDYTLYGDGTRKTVKYPSGITVTEDRDDAGRLDGISSSSGGDIYVVSSWKGNAQPAGVSIGGGLISLANSYDGRPRMTSSRYTAGGQLLVDMRYQHDGANNPTACQYVHRQGRTDFFAYDTGERVSSAHLGSVPEITEAEARPEGDYTPAEGGFGPGLLSRTYTYNGAGLDYLTGSTVKQPSNLAAGLLPPFAGSWSGHDSFLHATSIDGVSRGGTDPLGNVAATRLQVRPDGADGPAAVDADLTYNGLAYLTKVERDDGLVIENEYQPGGLRHFRRISQGGTVLSERAYVYDTARLIEEYEVGGSSPQLVGRYYYAHGDAPVAADLRHPVSGSLERYYFLQDARRSVVGVADATGKVVERIWYDPFGQPVIEGRDETPPVINRIEAAGGNSLRVFCSESVLPPINSAASPDLVASGGGFDAAFDVVPLLGGSALNEIVFEEAHAGGAGFGSVFRLELSGAATGTLNVNLAADALSDEWGNLSAAETEQVVFTGAESPGQVLYQRTSPADTAAPRHARSTVGNPFLFQGQYFDYDAGLIYMRLRFYDPFTGQFLQRDPLGYEDSVNLYAGFANNPVTYRDPSGAGVVSEFIDLARRRVSGFLTKQGLHDLEIQAISNVMMRRNERIRMSIRSFGSKAEIRQKWAAGGMRNKPAHQKAKTDATARVDTPAKGPQGDYQAVSDLDMLHLEINGRMASPDEVYDFVRQVNREYKELFHASPLGKLGISANTPFQHGSHTAMAASYGDKFLGKTLDDSYLAKVGHPGDSYTISVAGSGPNRSLTAYETPRWQTQLDIESAESILRERQVARGMDPVGFPKTAKGKSWHKWKNELRRHMQEVYDGVN